MLLFTIKLTHSLILIYMTVCIGIIWYSAIRNTTGFWLWIALISLALECLVFIGNGLRCPLSDWAVALGDTTGNDLLSEWLFPTWLIQYFSPICGTLLFGGLLALAYRFVTSPATIERFRQKFKSAH
jgi:hypothetical protein